MEVNNIFDSLRMPSEPEKTIGREQKNRLTVRSWHPGSRMSIFGNKIMRAKSFWSLVILISSTSLWAIQPITVTRAPDPSRIDLVLENVSADDYDIEFSLKNPANIDWPLGWPYRDSLQHGEARDLTMGIRAGKPYSTEWNLKIKKKGTSTWTAYSSTGTSTPTTTTNTTPNTTSTQPTSNQAIADRDAMLKDNSYAFPYSHGVSYAMTNGPMGFGWHVDQYAYDWPMPVGRNVCSARSGTVVATKSDSNRGGATEDFKNDANYVVIKHADGTYANYLHLSFNTVAVRKGQQVAAGTLLGKSGQTGWATEPHLHFHVANANNQTIPVNFFDKGKAISLRAGTSYAGFQPWYTGKASLPTDCVSCTCRTGKYDLVNCVIKMLPDLGLKGPAKSYWYDPKFGNLYKAAPCDEGKSDGVHCLVADASKLDGLPLGKANYWYDPKYGGVYSKAQCSE